MVALVKSPDGFLASLLGVIQAIGLGVVAYAVHRWLVPLVTRRIKLDEEELMLVALTALFSFPEWRGC